MRATRPSFRSGPTAVAVWGAWQEEGVRDGPRAAAYQVDHSRLRHFIDSLGHQHTIGRTLRLPELSLIIS